MKDPVRLLEAGATDKERALLRAAAADQPSAQAQMNLIVVLGLSTQTPPAVTDATPAASSRADASPSAKLVTKLASKWWVIGAGTLAVVAGIWMQHGNEHVPTRSEPATKPTNLLPAAAERPHSASAPTPEVRTTALPSARVPLPEPAEPGIVAAQPAGPRSIAHEIALLDEARARLAKQQARAALATLDSYRNQYPTGALRQEAMLLRIDALLGMHAQPAARRLAHRFLAENPTSPHGPRVRSLLSEKHDAR
jgi:hypothetical protein